MLQERGSGPGEREGSSEQPLHGADRQPAVRSRTAARTCSQEGLGPLRLFWEYLPVFELLV